MMLIKNINTHTQYINTQMGKPLKLEKTYHAQSKSKHVRVAI